MHHPVCTLAPGRAILASFFCTPPRPPAGPDLVAQAMAVTAPDLCACGEPLTLEMERDLGECVNCQCEAAGLSIGRAQ